MSHVDYVGKYKVVPNWFDHWSVVMHNSRVMNKFLYLDQKIYMFKRCGSFFIRVGTCVGGCHWHLLGGIQTYKLGSTLLCCGPNVLGELVVV